MASDPPPPRVRRHLRIRGHVQGVFFRASIAERARSSGVDGWALNLPDGSVEAVLEGDEEAVEALVEFCRHGPTDARVADLRVVPEPPAGADGFDVG